jgi:hypothetical protein
MMEWDREREGMGQGRGWNGIVKRKECDREEEGMG